MSKSKENAFDRLGETIYNITHANQIAEEREQARKATKKATAYGVLGVGVTALSTMYVAHRRRKFIEETSIKDRERYMNELNALDEKYTALEEKYKEMMKND